LDWRELKEVQQLVIGIIFRGKFGFLKRVGGKSKAIS